MIPFSFNPEVTKQIFDRADRLKSESDLDKKIIDGLINKLKLIGTIKIKELQEKEKTTRNNNVLPQTIIIQKFWFCNSFFVIFN